MMRIHINALGFSCLLVVLLLAAGCSSGRDAPEATGPPQTEVSGQSPQSEATFPVTLAYRDLVAVEEQLELAIAIEVEDCLVNEGFTRLPLVSMESERATDVLDTMPPQDFFMVRPAPDRVTTEGFDAFPIAAILNEPPAGGALNDALASMTAGDNAALTIALYGPNDEWAQGTGGSEVSSFSVTGCYGGARQDLTDAVGGFGPLMDQRRALESARGDVYSMAEADERNSAALTQWQSCMTEGGFGSYEHPRDVIPILIGLRSASDSSAELELAVGDSQCFEEAQLQEVWEATVAEAETAVVQTVVFRDTRQWGLDNYPNIIAASVDKISAYEQGEPG